MFKNILHPKQHCKVQDQAPATTTFKLQVQTQDTQMLDQGAACMAAPVEDTCWPPMGTHLGHLPSHLVSCAIDCNATAATRFLLLAQTDMTRQAGAECCMCSRFDVQLVN